MFATVKGRAYRALGRDSRLHRAMAMPQGSEGSNLLEVDKWASSRIVLSLLRTVDYHPYALDELLLMTAAFAYHRPQVVIDIGTHFGKSARIWHELGKRLQTGTVVHTIDILDPTHPEFPGDKHGQFIRGIGVRQHIGDGEATARSIISENPSLSYLLFLDGDHSYETVLRELQLARLLRRGGVLVHDTFYQPSSTYNHGPYLAIQEFLRTFTCKQAIHLQVGLPGMSYIGLCNDGAI